MTTRRFELWWRKVQAWFATQFASINVDLTPVEEKVDEVKTAVENINVESADLLAQFFGVTLLEGYEFMTDTEVCGELEDIMQLVDPDLTAEQAAAITAQTLNPSES